MSEKDLHEFLPIGGAFNLAVRLLLVRPGFEADVLTVIKAQEMVALNRQGGDAQAVAMREGMIWHFNGHVYGRDPLLGPDRAARHYR